MSFVFIHSPSIVDVHKHLQMEFCQLPWVSGAIPPVSS